MVRRKLVQTNSTCPICGAKLARERNLLRCVEHGAFFAYGPHLLVRAPGQRLARTQTALPWEVEEARHHS